MGDAGPAGYPPREDNPGMATRRLAGIGLALVALLALASLASRGPRPLGVGGGQPRIGVGFFDYAFTTLLVACVAAVVLVVVAAYGSQRDPGRQQASQWKLIAVLTFVVLVFLLLARTHALPQNLLGGVGRRTGGGARHTGLKPLPTRGGRNVHFRWEEAAVVGGLAAALLVAAVGRSRLARRGSEPAEDDFDAAAADVSAVLDDALDDLRSETDVRRAVIAAYARMEGALAAHGLPRRRSEAPLEYLERALVRLRASAVGVRRLTDLFEWAKFSHHDVDAAMRDEAVDALAAVRDELRAPA
jgi:hypothetical protein